MWRCSPTCNNQDPISVDDIIERRKSKQLSKKRKRATEEEDLSDDSESSEEDNDISDDASDAGDSEEESELDAEDNVESDEEADPLATSDEGKEDEEDEQDSDEDDVASDDSGDSDSEEETQAEKDRKAAFFDSEGATSEEHASFLTMNLSRPVHKAITSLGFNKPTPIQAATIPVALLGKDVVGNAVTGSGKTAAFIIPMLERLLYRERGKKAAATRCLVLVPTRELGVQCFEVGKKLAANTDIRFCLIVGTSSTSRSSCTTI